MSRLDLFFSNSFYRSPEKNKGKRIQRNMKEEIEGLKNHQGSLREPFSFSSRSFWASIGYSFIYNLFRMVVNVFFKDIQVVGTENIPKDGPVVFVGNHNNQFVVSRLFFLFFSKELIN